MAKYELGDKWEGCFSVLSRVWEIKDNLRRVVHPQHSLGQYTCSFCISFSAPFRIPFVVLLYAVR